MELLTYQETVRETGIDPAADPDLPDLPEWIKHPPVERVADMDTATIPVVREEVPVSTDQVLMIARMLGAAGGASQAGASEEEIAAAIDAAEEVQV